MCMNLRGLKSDIEHMLHVPLDCVTASKRGHHFIGIVKTSHARFSKQYIEEKLKGKSAGSRLVLTTKLEVLNHANTVSVEDNSRKRSHSHANRTVRTTTSLQAWCRDNRSGRVVA
jgi:hypothetical protein